MKATTIEITKVRSIRLQLHDVIYHPDSGKFVDPMGYIREVFINSGDGLLMYLLNMINVIKKSKIIPLEWNEMWIKTFKKKKGSYRTLNNYRGIFIVPIIGVIF